MFLSVCVYVTGTDGTCFEIPLWINGGSQRPDHTVVISILEGSGQTSGAQLDGRPWAVGFLMCEDAVVALRRRRRSVRSLDLLNENKQRRGLITHWRPSSVTTALHCTALPCTALLHNCWKWTPHLGQRELLHGSSHMGDRPHRIIYGGRIWFKNSTVNIPNKRCITRVLAIQPTVPGVTMARWQRE